MKVNLNEGIPWKKKLTGHLQLARISNSPTVVSNVLAGAAMTGVMMEDQIPVLFILAIAMVLFYTAGMYLNDIFDYEIDLRERPERPLPSGLIDIRTASITAALFLITGLILLAFAGQGAFISGLILIGIILFYDYWHKTNPYSHYVMALARVMVYVTAFAAFSGELSMEFILAAFFLFLYVSGLTFIAKSENKPDFSRYWPVLIMILPAIYFGYAMEVSFLPVAVFFLIWSFYSLYFVYRNRNKDIGGGIVRLIAGLSLFDAMVIASYAMVWPLVITFALFGLTRFFQGYIKGS